MVWWRTISRKSGWNAVKWAEHSQSEEWTIIWVTTVLVFLAHGKTIIVQASKIFVFIFFFSHFARNHFSVSVLFSLFVRSDETRHPYNASQDQKRWQIWWLISHYTTASRWIFTIFSASHCGRRSVKMTTTTFEHGLTLMAKMAVLARAHSFSHTHYTYTSYTKSSRRKFIIM